MKKAMALAVVALALALLMPAFAFAASSDPTVTITVIGADNEPMAGVKVVLYDADGNEYANTTDDSGVAKITVPANDTYLVVVKGDYYILSTVTVSGDTSATVNATTMHMANLTATPLSVDVDVLLLAFNYTSITVRTNATVYAPSDVNVTYPSEVVKFPFKYVFEKLTYDTSETNETTVTLDMAKDYLVTASYTKTFYLTLEYWLVIALVVIIVVALVVAWKAGGKAAAAMIAEWKERKRRFVKRRE